MKKYEANSVEKEGNGRYKKDAVNEIMWVNNEIFAKGCFCPFIGEL